MDYKKGFSILLGVKQDKTSKEDLSPRDQVVVYKREYLKEVLIYFISSFSTNENELELTWTRRNNSKENFNSPRYEESVSAWLKGVTGQKEILSES